MDAAVSVLICFFSALVEVYSAVPPDICFQQFKWEDCGMPPKAVIYYYKSGSRCEVGFWRGCQPNPNMFVDEYECVQTCIFSLRAKPENYHQFEDNIIESDDTTPAEIETTVQDAGNDTITDNPSDSTGADGAGVDGAGDGDVTGKTDGGGADGDADGITSGKADGETDANAEGQETQR